MSTEIGIAFQIQDDILDYNRQNNTGKPVNNDLREHKITLPLIEVMERERRYDYSQRATRHTVPSSAL